MNREKTKLRLLSLYRILREYSDASHPLTAREMLDLLEGDDVEAERKSIYRDLNAISESGVDIVHTTAGYCIDKREFELSELKKISHAVISCKDISAKTCDTLISKLGLLTSAYGRKELPRVVSPRRPESDGEIFAVLDMIGAAASTGKKLAFGYVPSGTVEKVMVRALARLDGYYYLVSAQGAAYRVDLMTDVGVTGEKAKVSACSADEKSILALIEGERTNVSLAFDEGLCGRIKERFPGARISISGKVARTNVDVHADEIFFAWVFSFGGGVRITAPAGVIDAYRKMLASCLKSAERDTDDEKSETDEKNST